MSNKVCVESTDQVCPKLVEVHPSYTVTERCPRVTPRTEDGGLKRLKTMTTEVYELIKTCFPGSKSKT